MDEIQIRKYKELSALKDAYKAFIKRKGDIGIVYYSSVWHDFVHCMVKDDEFKEIVKNIAKERLENINKQIKKL